MYSFYWLAFWAVPLSTMRGMALSFRSTSVPTSVEQIVASDATAYRDAYCTSSDLMAFRRRDAASGCEDSCAHLHRRRQFLTVCIVGAVSGASSQTPAANAAIGLTLSNDSNRRQLELCLVALLRVLYWAEYQAQALETVFLQSDEGNDERRRKLYLETRLGAKAILTGKIGPGATGSTYTLATLQLAACLDDLEWHASRSGSTADRSYKQRVSELRRSFTEGLASVVEFDGLETLIDPSPRSSLTLSQYNPSKAVFVRRVLRELVLPVGNKLALSFGPEPLERSIAFTQQYYASEIPTMTTTAQPMI
jgi:hypothetical protein